MPTLAIHTGAIGDFLLACPALAALAQTADLELAGDRSRLDLAVAAKIARAAHGLDAVEFHTLFGTPSQRFEEFIQRFDRVIVWMSDPDRSLRTGLATAGARHVEIFPGLPDAAWPHHASKYYAHCLGLADLSSLRLNIAPAGPPLDVVIHPGSGSPVKNWPLGNFAAAAHAFNARDRRVTWCAGPAEIERGTLTTLPASAEVLRCDSLVDLARRLTTAHLYLGNDSGITHLAAALDIPTIALFGPTNPNIWGPLGDHVQVLQGDPWPTLEDAIAAIGP